MTNKPDIGTTRIMDASANRASEAIRVIEDYVRFVLDDPFLSGLCKNLRHSLAEALAGISSHDRIAARETQQDVGTELSTQREYARTDMADVLAANFNRLREALRSLEEYAKTFSGEMAARIEPLRYQSYSLQRAVCITTRSSERLADVRLYVLVDGRESPEAFALWIERLINAGVHAIQLRDKNLADRELLQRARILRQTIERVVAEKDIENRPLFIMNDRPDLAVLARADGVHVGQDELSVKDARTILGPDPLIGVSTHSIKQVHQAILDGADYIGVGPTFPSTTKAFTDFPGIPFAVEATATTKLPAFAIGGVNLENVDQLIEKNVTRIAVSGAIADEPERVVSELLSKLKTTPPSTNP